MGVVNRVAEEKLWVGRYGYCSVDISTIGGVVGVWMCVGMWGV